MCLRLVAAASRTGRHPAYPERTRTDTHTHRPWERRWDPGPRGCRAGSGGSDSRRLRPPHRCALGDRPPPAARGHLEASLIVGVLFIALPLPLGLLLLLVLEFFLPLFVRGVVAALALRLLVQVLLVLRQLVVAPLQDQRAVRAAGPRGSPGCWAEGLPWERAPGTACPPCFLGHSEPSPEAQPEGLPLKDQGGGSGGSRVGVHPQARLPHRASSVQPAGGALEQGSGPDPVRGSLLCALGFASLVGQHLDPGAQSTGRDARSPGAKGARNATGPARAPAPRASFPSRPRGPPTEQRVSGGL